MKSSCPSLRLDYVILAYCTILLTPPARVHKVQLMRHWLVGLFILITPTLALAQVKGQVLNIGFNSVYRPDCWTPMLVQLTNTSTEPGEFQLQVLQEDLDHDHAIYTRQITLSGSAEGHGNPELFWMYFRPKPTDGGLPDATDVSSNLRTLNNELHVYLCSRDGSKQLATLPITSTILDVDREGDRSSRVVLFVCDKDKPLYPDYTQLKGVTENMFPVPVRIGDLPTDVRGYEGVDDIVWMDGDANALTQGTQSGALVAIQQWVHQGGHLIITQPADANRIRPFAVIMPVGAVINNVWTIPIVDRLDLDALRSLVSDKPEVPNWPKSKQPFKVGRVVAAKEAKVLEWMEWDDKSGATRPEDVKKTFSPWLARRPVGLGAVTWVAQDLGNPYLTTVAANGWRFIWDRVLDWDNEQNVPEVYKAKVGPGQIDPWVPGQPLDLGRPMTQNLDLTSKAWSLVGLAMLFFVVYGFVAAGGSHMYLMYRKATEWSWFIFAGSAVVGTGLTVLLVKFAVSGPPQLKHLSVIRTADTDTTSIIDSRFGLYIPQDGAMEIAVKDNAPQEVSTITPLPAHPKNLTSQDIIPAYLQYDIPIRDASESETLSVSVPYRSSSKKFEVRWIGHSDARIDVPSGSPDVALVPSTATRGQLKGTLVNHTGYDLGPVYIAFESPPYPSDTASVNEYTYLIYVPLWKKDVELTLDDRMDHANVMGISENGRMPGGKDETWGWTNGGGSQWDSVWGRWRDSMRDEFAKSMPVLALFEHVQPWKADQINPNRFELWRRSARELDISNAVSAGGLVVFGIAIGPDGNTDSLPLPLPLTVSGSPVKGTGQTIFQFVVPLNRSQMYLVPK